jgi:hypothetical protein
MSETQTRPIRPRRFRRIRRLSLVLGAIAMSCTLTTVTASADAIADQDTMLRSWGSGACLDSNESGAAYALGCNWGEYQVWFTGGTGINIVTGNVSHPVIILRDEQTNRCLDSNYQGSVYTNPCWGNDNYQYWTWWGDNYQGQYQNYQTGLCLQTDGNAVWTQQCGNDPANSGYQLWRQGF